MIHITATQENAAALSRLVNGKYTRNKTPDPKIKQIREMISTGASMKKIASALHVSLELARGVRDGKR